MSSLLGELQKDKSLENNVDLLQQIALLKFLRSSEATSQASTLYQFVAAARVGNEVYQRVSKKRKIDEYRAEFFTNLVTYLQKNPNASQKSIKTEVERLTGVFILQLKQL